MRASRRGGNAVEFALLLPIMMGLLTAIVDYSWYTALRLAADSAATEGSRAGAMTDRDENPASVAIDAATARWTELGLPGTPTIVAFQSGTPEAMVVRVEVDVTQLIGFVAGPSKVDVTALRHMEDQP